MSESLSIIQGLPWLLHSIYCSSFSKHASAGIQINLSLENRAFKFFQNTVVDALATKAVSLNLCHFSSFQNSNQECNSSKKDLKISKCVILNSNIHSCICKKTSHLEFYVTSFHFIKIESNLIKMYQMRVIDHIIYRFLRKMGNIAVF